MSRIALAVVMSLATVVGCAAPTPATSCWLALRATYHLADLPGDKSVDEAINAAGIMHDRLSAVGLAEFRVAVDAGVITVDLPTLNEEASDEIRGLLRTTGHLAILPVTAGKDLVVGDPAPSAEALIDETDLTDIRVSTDQGGGSSVEIAFTDTAAVRMRDYTGAHLGGQLAIAMDGTVVSAPTVQAAVGSPLQISGGFDFPAERLVAVLQTGPYAGTAVEDTFVPASPPPNCVA